MGLGARADVTYGPDVVCRKAKFVALKYDEILLDGQFQRRNDVICIGVVVRILYKFE